MELDDTTIKLHHQYILDELIKKINESSHIHLTPVINRLADLKVSPTLEQYLNLFTAIESPTTNIEYKHGSNYLKSLVNLLIRHGEYKLIDVLTVPIKSIDWSEILEIARRIDSIDYNRIIIAPISDTAALSIVTKYKSEIKNNCVPKNVHMVYETIDKQATIFNNINAYMASVNPDNIIKLNESKIISAESMTIRLFMTNLNILLTKIDPTSIYEVQQKLEILNTDTIRSVAQYKSNKKLDNAHLKGLVDGKMINFSKIARTIIANKLASQLNDIDKDIKLYPSDIRSGYDSLRSTFGDYPNEMLAQIISHTITSYNSNFTASGSKLPNGMATFIDTALCELERDKLLTISNKIYGNDRLNEDHIKFNMLAERYIEDTANESTRGNNINLSMPITTNNTDSETSATELALPTSLKQSALTKEEKDFVENFHLKYVIANNLKDSVISKIRKFFLTLLSERVIITMNDFEEIYTTLDQVRDLERIKFYMFKFSDSIYPISSQLKVMSGIFENSVYVVNSELLEALKISENHHNLFIHSTLPMICPPTKFITKIGTKGGYLTHKIPLIFHDENYNFDHTYTSNSYKNMSHVINSINTISSIPWNINTRILGVLYTILENDGIESINHFQIKKKNLLSHHIVNNTTPSRHEIQLQSIEDQIRSQNKATLIEVLTISTYYANQDIYFPHYLDFRGRMYPASSSLSYQNRDFIRALFTFKESKRLGSAGLRWLKIHISNLYGVDKVSLGDRMEFVERNIDLIRIISKNPFSKEHEYWWQKADNPIQFLSACMELTNALDSGDPENYSSNLPIHQDGSCNGLQHYCALGKDILGAEKVNLFGYDDTPNDIYSYVAGLVKDEIDIDYKKNPELHISHYIKHIDRKLIKRPVMTSVYGVKLYGAALQIEEVLNKHIETYLDIDKCTKEYRQFYETHLKKTTIKKRTGDSKDKKDGIHFDIGKLDDADNEVDKLMDSMGEYFSFSMPLENINNSTTNNTTLDIFTNVTNEDIEENNQLLNEFIKRYFVSKASFYIAELTLKKIGTAFTLSSEYQNWLMECSDVISKKQNLVRWYTPIGFEVVQYYFENNTPSSKINKLIQKYIDHEVPLTQMKFPVDSRKNKNAISPNYIHSMDSTHLMNTVNTCYRNNITMAAVHDSYWTHASTIDDMNNVLREEFVKMYTADNVKLLKEQFETIYSENNGKPGNQFPKHPTRGYFDLDKIRNSKYFFH